jgi:hypothetical protein
MQSLRGEDGNPNHDEFRLRSLLSQRFRPAKQKSGASLAPAFITASQRTNGGTRALPITKSQLDQGRIDGVRRKKKQGLEISPASIMAIFG